MKPTFVLTHPDHLSTDAVQRVINIVKQRVSGAELIVLEEGAKLEPLDITLHQWYAGLAMHAILTHQGGAATTDGTTVKPTAAFAHEQADAMLAEGEKGTGLTDAGA